MDQPMDQNVDHVQQIDQQLPQNQPQNQIPSEEPHKEIQEIRPVRKPGRPPRQRGRQKDPNKIKITENVEDQQFEGQRPKMKQKNFVHKEQSNVEGFVKIIDYLKKIECSEGALHNKMNPYNLLTPTCFWFLVSAQYFSYDFFSHGNPTQSAVQILKKAQRTHISLPQRILKPVRSQNCLQFQTRSLRQTSKPVTDKLINLIPNPSSLIPEATDKSNHITTTLQDDYFRSSTRAIIFNYVKNKIKTNQRWANVLLPRIKINQEIPKKEFLIPLIKFQDERGEGDDTPPEMLYRQRRKQKDKLKHRSGQSMGKSISHQKPKPKNQDNIFDEESSMKVQHFSPKEQINPDQLKSQQQKQEHNQSFSQHSEHSEHLSQENLQEINHVKEQMQNQIKEEEERIEENQSMLDEQEQNLQQFIKITKNYTQDDVLLDAIMHLPLDSVISILQSAISPVELPQIEAPYLPIPKNDPLEFVYQIHPEEEKFMNYMKQRQQKIYEDKTVSNEEIMEEKQKQVQIQDAKCQICTDGDYTEDNLIVFCSMCNISLHQRCVGLAKVPADSWICQVCAAFGPAGINVPCPLCNVKGGALKRTSIHINSNIFRDTNVLFHEYAKKCPFVKMKEEYMMKENQQDQPYYDYFLKSTYPTDQPVCNYVWVHYVCAIWVPQCYFQEKNGQINIKGIQNIDKKRFKERCLICNNVKGGACIKCDNESCDKYYHPECARKKKIYMEQLNLDKLKYLIFCQAHEPLKVRRKIEVKKKKYRDQIVKFCRGIEKFVQTYKIAHLNFKLLKTGLNHALEGSKIEKKEKHLMNDQKAIIPKIQKFTDEDFIDNVISNLNKKNTIVVNLSKQGDGYKVDDVVLPSKRDLRKFLNRQDDFWKDCAQGETAENNLKRFHSIVREKSQLKDKIQCFISYGKLIPPKKHSPEKKSGRKGRRRKQNKQTIIEEEGGTFCICRRPYEGQDDMIQCDVCQEWYHHKCIGFIGSEEDAQNMEFHCMKCMKFQSQEEKQLRIAKVKRFFTEDSQFLYYRPPTPDLSAELNKLPDPQPMDIQQQEERQEVVEEKPWSAGEDHQEDIHRQSSIVTPHFNLISLPQSEEKESQKKQQKKEKELADQ